MLRAVLMSWWVSLILLFLRIEDGLVEVQLMTPRDLYHICTIGVGEVKERSAATA